MRLIGVREGKVKDAQRWLRACARDRLETIATLRKAGATRSDVVQVPSYVVQSFSFTLQLAHSYS